MSLNASREPCLGLPATPGACAHYCSLVFFITITTIIMLLLLLLMILFTLLLFRKEKSLVDFVSQSETLNINATALEQTSYILVLSFDCFMSILQPLSISYKIVTTN